MTSAFAGILQLLPATFSVMSVSATVLPALAVIAIGWLLTVSHRRVPTNCTADKEPEAADKERLSSLQQQLTSVNWHFLRQCNYRCAFCYHVDYDEGVIAGPRAAKPRTVTVEEGKLGLRRLVACGMKKLNFSGGEPFLEPKFLAIMCRYAKELGVYVSIITNGSLVTEAWLAENGRYVDMIGVSIDSCSDDTHEEIGRFSPSLMRGGNPMAEYHGHIAKARLVAHWCRQNNIAFKVNTVVNSLNVGDDMTSLISELNPKRWKVFELLEIEGENSGPTGKRNAGALRITPAQFAEYVKRHEALKARGTMVVEDNVTMRNSYVIVDERLRFLDNASNRKVPSRFSLVSDDAVLASHEARALLRRTVNDTHRDEAIDQFIVLTAFAGTTFDRVAFDSRKGNFFLNEAPQQVGAVTHDIEDMQ